jgi:hypothetical protein
MSSDWTERELLVNLCVTAEEQRRLLEHLNNAERTGAVSSVEIKYLAPTKDRPEAAPAPAIKVFDGSEPPVEEAIIAYGKTLLLMQQAVMEGWEKTVARLEFEKTTRRSAQAAD